MKKVGLYFISFLSYILIIVASGCNPQAATNTHVTSLINNEAIAQVWESGEIIATGIVVGNGSQVLTVLNYEVNTPDSLKLSVIVPGHGEYDAHVQNIDSRTGASLLQIEGGKFSKTAAINDSRSLSPEQQLFIWDGYKTIPVLYNSRQDDLPLVFNVYFSSEALQSGSVPEIGQGSVVTDEQGNVLGLVGVDLNEIITHPHPFGFIPGIVIADSALEALSSNTPQPWMDGPIMFISTSYSSTLVTYGPFSKYDDIAVSLQGLLSDLGEPIPASALPDDFYEILSGDLLPTEYILTIVYASPVELRNTDGAVVAQAKWISFLYNTEEKPFNLMYGSGKLIIEGGFVLSSSLDEIEEVVP